MTGVPDPEGLPVKFVPISRSTSRFTRRETTKGILIGGIRFGYETGENGFNAGVFVGSSFDLSKR